MAEKKVGECTDWESGNRIGYAMAQQYKSTIGFGARNLGVF